MTTKQLKPGINQPIICKKCGYRVGYIRLKSRIKWKTIWYGLVLGLALEIIANAVVYLVFVKFR